MDKILNLLIVLLFVSDTPFGRGWIPVGDFIPRLLLFCLLVIFNGARIFNKATVLLLLYFLYKMIMNSTNSVENNPIGLTVELFEFLIPMLLFVTLKFAATSRDILKLNRYSFCVSVAVIVCTIIALMNNPSIARLMASASNFKDGLAEIRTYQRVGVAAYDFSAVVMFFPVVLMAYFKECYLKKNYFFVGMLLFFTFLFKVQASTPMILSLVITSISYFINDKTDKRFVLQAGILICMMVLLFPVFLDLVAPFVASTAFENKVIGLTEFAETGQTSGEVLGRYELYEISMKSFSEGYFFGHADAFVGGHSFILDRLARYGIVGVALLLSSLYFAFKYIYIWISYPYRWHYLLCVFALISFMVIKNVAGMDYWLYMFVFIPCIFKYVELKK